jgi:phage baseplate assembly protein V
MLNLKNLLRIGTVSSIDYGAGTVRVIIEDQDEIVTDDLPMLSHEYEMPNVGEVVLCLFLGTGNANGFCLGRFYYDDEAPVWSGQNIFYKRFLKDAYIKYDKSSKTFTLCASEIIFDGNVSITGNLAVAGNASVGGTATIGGDATINGRSFMGHTHSGVKAGSDTSGAVV